MAATNMNWAGKVIVPAGQVIALHFSALFRLVSTRGILFWHFGLMRAPDCGRGGCVGGAWREARAAIAARRVLGAAERRAPVLSAIQHGVNVHHRYTFVKGKYREVRERARLIPGAARGEGSPACPPGERTGLGMGSLCGPKGDKAGPGRWTRRAARDFDGVAALQPGAVGFERCTLCCPRR